MSLKIKLYILLLLDFLLFVALYVLCYSFSLYTLAFELFGFILPVMSLPITYLGTGVIRDYFAIALRNNEQEIRGVVYANAFYTERWGQIDPVKRFWLHAAVSIIAITTIGGGGVLMYFFVKSGPEFVVAQQAMNNIFLSATIFGLLLRIDPINRKFEAVMKRIRQ